jgi:hypothetical protein
MTANVERPDLGGDRANQEMPYSKVDPSTQCGMVLSTLRRQPMSAAELQWHLPIADARAVVRDLIAKGYRIEKRDHPNPDLAARRRKIRRYHLVEPE